MSKEQKQPQGLKGFFLRAGKSFYDGGLFAKETSTWMAKWAGKIGFVIATTSMVVLMPLLFEIGRESQVRRLLVMNSIIHVMQCSKHDGRLTYCSLPTTR